MSWCDCGQSGGKRGAVVTSSSSEYMDLWDRVRRATDLNEMKELHNEIAENEVITGSESSSLQLYLFGQIRSVTTGTYEDAVEFIRGDLLRLCLQDQDATETSADADQSWVERDRQRARELLKDWIDDYTSTQQLQLIAGLVSELMPLLGQPNGVRAFRVIATIGYRDDDIVEHLFDHAERSSSLLAQCIDTLISLGVCSDDRMHPLVTQLIDSDEPQKAVFALARMDATESTGMMKSCLNRIDEPGGHKGYLHWALSACAKAIARHQESERLQDWFWDIVKNHKSLVLMDGRLAGFVNSTRVIPDLLNWLPSLTSIEDEHLRVSRVSNRLETCVHSRHLTSWRDGCRSEAIEILRRVAVADTGDESDFGTTRDKAKVSASRILLSLGCDDLQDLLVQAVRSETNRHVQSDLMELGSCLALKKLPDFVVDLIIEEFNCQSGDVKPLLQRGAATTLVRSAASYESFEILLSFGYTLDGSVLLQTSEALAEVALFLCEAGDGRVVPRLIDRIGEQHAPRHREAACRALSHIGGHGLIPRSNVSDVVAHLADEELPDYARADLVSSLHGLEFGIRDRAVSTVAKLAESSLEDRVTWECCVFMVRQPFWEEFVGLVFNRIGWNGEEALPPESESCNAWRAWLIGELFLRSPSRFSKALSHVFRKCDDDSCYQLYRCLDRATEFPREVVDAVESRVFRDMTPYRSHAFLLSLLGRADHTRLVGPRLFECIERWTIESKVAYTDALISSSDGNTEFRARRTAVLDALAGDGAVAVRRAAYLANLRLAPDLFVTIWRLRAQSNELRLRIQAAESLEFLPSEIWSNRNDEDLDRLAQDRFRRIRDTVEDSLEHAYRRSHAHELVEQVMAVSGTSDSELIAAFPYGEALKRCGDRESIERLRAHLSVSQPPPNVFEWIRQIIKAIEKAYDGVEREVSRGWHAIMEHFDGVLKSDSRSCDATLHLWKVPNEDFVNLGSWGGTAVPSENTAALTPVAFVMDGGYVTVESDGRQAGIAIVTRTKDERMVIIQGSGAYPSRLHE